MRMWLGKIVVVLSLLVVSQAGLSQGRADAHVREGDRHFQQMAYARAITSYTAAAELGAVNEHVTKRLAESHMRLGNTVEAERWYAVVVKFLNREPRDLYNYAQALKGNGRYQEAEEWMDRYLAMMGPDAAGSRSNITGFARKYSQDQDRFTIRPVAINTPYSEFGTAWLGRDKVIYTSSRNTTVGLERKAALNDQPFLDLFVADILPGGDLGNARPMGGSVNTKYHEGPASASMNGDVLWFTRNSYFQGRSQRSRQGVSRLGIFRASAIGGDEYGRVERFLFNNSEVSMGHPSLSADGQRLYFVSDMPGGFGGTDIYVCRLQEGRWGEPENLGPVINTVHNETFPFISADGTLYFSSSGHPGLGGLDIYAAKPAGAKGFSSVINVGAPVNSPKDDFAFIIDPTGTRGYFSSDRPGGAGDDDIYSFVMHKPLEERYLCIGTVIDDEYEIPVFAAEVLLYDLNGALLDTAFTDSRGEFSFPVQKDKAYRLVARLKGRYDGEQFFSTERIEQQQIITRDVHLVADAGIWMRGSVRYKDRLGFIEGMTVTVVNLSSYYSESQRTGEGGGFSFRLQSNEEFEVLFEKPGFFTQSIPVSTIGVRQGVLDLNEVRDLEFEPIVIGSPIALRYVRWAGSSTDLDVQARVQLDALAERLLVNPDVLIEVGVHADARSDAADAQRSTQRQAEAVASYLQLKGVPKDRVKSKGYGTSQLLNHCVPGVTCTEKEHAVNRRTEYKVTGLLDQ
jgi:outer membrane protein OmpA-like peptidoglycan-associated protein